MLPWIGQSLHSTIAIFPRKFAVFIKLCDTVVKMEEISQSPTPIHRLTHNFHVYQHDNADNPVGEAKHGQEEDRQRQDVFFQKTCGLPQSKWSDANLSTAS